MENWKTNVLNNGVFCACFEFVETLSYISENKNDKGRHDFWERSRAKFSEINARYNYALTFLYAAQYRPELSELWNAQNLFRGYAQNVAEYADGLLDWQTPDEAEHFRECYNNAYSRVHNALSDVPRLGVYPTEADALDAAPNGSRVFKFQRGSLYLAYIVDLDGVLTPDKCFELIER